MRSIFKNKDNYVWFCVEIPDQDDHGNYFAPTDKCAVDALNLMIGNFDPRRLKVEDELIYENCLFNYYMSD